MLLVLSAPAKINLTLEVLSRRKDGYHTLRSLMAPIGIFDRITVEQASSSSFSSNVPELNHDNIVAKALRASGLTTHARVTLEKRIPVGGGLGGGSSDAAAVLKAAMEGSLGPVPSLDWITVARELGSDVPFFLSGTGALVEGTGERLTPIGALPPWWTLVVRPGMAVATAQAYQLLASSRIGGAPSRPRADSCTLAAIDALQRGDLQTLREQLVNDFHEPILKAHPLIAQAHAWMLAAGAPQALLSGSGSCLFSLFSSEAEAQEVQSRLARSETIADTFVAPFVREGSWR